MRFMVLMIACAIGILAFVSPSKAADIDINVEVRVYDNGIFAPIEGAVVELKWDAVTKGKRTTDANGVAGYERFIYTRPDNDATLQVFINGVLVDTITFTQSTNGVQYLDYFIPG